MLTGASREGAMSGKDKAENTGDKAKGDLKQAGEHVKDVLKH
ncbi:hypothetical protein [Streptomyces sp. NPDC054837]